MARSSEKMHLLMVDDSDDDEVLLRYAVSAAKLPLEVGRVTGVIEAIAYLKGEAPFSDRHAHPFPHLMFVDLKMPCHGGLELLEWLRDSPKCSAVPTIVLSSSAHPEDIRRAYQLGANAYMTKPTSIPDLVDILRATEHFWRVCECPNLPPDTRC